jgi:hypothetical protein
MNSLSTSTEPVTLIPPDFGQKAYALVETVLSDEIKQQIRDFQKVPNTDPQYSETLLNWGIVLVKFAKRKLKEIKQSGGKDRAPHTWNALREVLMMALDKFEALSKLNKDSVTLFEKWGDTFLLLCRHYDLPLYESACEKYFSALLLNTDSPKLHRKYAVALSKRADFLYKQTYRLGHSSRNHTHEKKFPEKCKPDVSSTRCLNPSDLCDLADMHFSKAIVLDPVSAKTYVLWAKSLQSRMERTRDEVTAISILTAVSSKWHQALALVPKNTHYLSRWAQSIDFLIDLHANTSRFGKNKQHEVDIANLIEIYLQAYRHFATITKWKLPLPIKPLIAFALLENERISRLALQVLQDVTNNSLVPDTKREAQRNLHILEEILKNRYEINNRNKQRVFETFKELPRKLQEEITKGRGKLTDEEAVEIGQYYEIFLNCIHFVLRRYLDDDDGKARKLYAFLHKRSQSIRNVGVYVNNQQHYDKIMKEARNKESEYKFIKIKSKIESFDENITQNDNEKKPHTNTRIGSNEEHISHQIQGEEQNTSAPSSSLSTPSLPSLPIPLSTSPSSSSSHQQEKSHQCVPYTVTRSSLPPAPSSEVPISSSPLELCRLEVKSPSNSVASSLTPTEKQSTTLQQNTNITEETKTNVKTPSSNRSERAQRKVKESDDSQVHSYGQRHRHSRHSSRHSEERSPKTKERKRNKKRPHSREIPRNESSTDAARAAPKLTEDVINTEKLLISSPKTHSDQSHKDERTEPIAVLPTRARTKSSPVQHAVTRHFQPPSSTPLGEETKSSTKSKKGLAESKETLSRPSNQIQENAKNERLVSSRHTEVTKPISEMSMQELETFFKKENPKLYYKNRVEIGTGGFGDVYIATPKFKTAERKQVAIKVSRKEITTLSQMQNIVREICVMKECKHKNIVNFLDAYLWENRAWIVMEYCDGGSLGALAKGAELTEPEIAFIIRQVVEGLAFLHSRKRVHRDIKADNILLNFNGEVKIADLGLVEDLESLIDSADGEIDNKNDKAKRGGMAGSCYWMAPEIIKKHRYGSKVDIWALGCLIYELIEQAPPYYSEGALMAMFVTATHGAPPLKNYSAWSEHLIDFISLCLQVNPKNRPSARMLLEHPFLQKQRNFDLATLKEKMTAVFIDQVLRDGGLL